MRAGQLPRLFTLAWLALSTACAPLPASDAARAAITNGQPDDGDPAVVALLDAGGKAGCSGSLIAPHVVLTAAHCGIDAVNFAGYRAFFGSSVAAGGTLVDVAGALVDASFDPATFANDLTLLALREAGPASPLSLDARTLDGALVGQSVQAVGFGVSSAGAGDGGLKRTGQVSVTAVGAGDFTTAAGPSLPCAGDSGGPALSTVGGVAVVSGVTSHGDSACSDHAAFQRVDVAQAGFIEPFLQATAPGSAAVGDRCFFDEQCASGSCLVAADEPRRAFCSKACHARSDCPSTMICATDGCRYAAPSPGALGASCAQLADCASGLCYASACTQACVAAGSSCPSGYTCTNTADITFYCIKTPPHSGCSMTGALGSARAPAPVAAALALLLLWLTRRIISG